MRRMGRRGLRSLNSDSGLPTPAVGGPWAWYRADWVNGTPSLPSAGDLAQWNDVSGNGRHLTQPTSGNRPVFTLDVQNGLPAVAFVQDGANSDYMLSTYSHGAPWSFVAVVNVTDVSVSGSNVLSGFHASDNASFFVTQTSGTAAIWGGTGQIGDTTNIEDAWTICAGVVNGASSKIVGGDGTAETGDATGSNAVQNFTIGAGNDPLAAFMTGFLGEAIVFTSVLSDADINALATDMKNRWNATWTNI